MTPGARTRTVDRMRNPLRPRHSYLDRLALEPLLRDVSRPLMVEVARVIDEIHVDGGHSLSCAPNREVLVVVEGSALLTLRDEPAATLCAGTCIGGAPGRLDPNALIQLTALTPMRCFAVSRRELKMLHEIAPTLAHAMRAAAGEHNEPDPARDIERRTHPRDSRSSPVR
jgi:hypothetical protein